MAIEPTFAVPDQVGRLLSGLLGKSVVVKKGNPLAPGTKMAVGEYFREDGTLGAVCVCDLGTASSAGAALSLMPAGIAAESIKIGKLNETLADNMQEIFNVLTRLFQNPMQPRVHFKLMYLPPQSLSNDANNLIKKPTYRADFDVAIPSYPSGKMSVYVL